jgi:hypothetical protein
LVPNTTDVKKKSLFREQNDLKPAEMFAEFQLLSEL